MESPNAMLTNPRRGPALFVYGEKQTNLQFWEINDGGFDLHESINWQGWSFFFCLNITKYFCNVNGSCLTVYITIILCPKNIQKRDVQ